jgi:DnaK suppressor protein
MLPGLAMQATISRSEFPYFERKLRERAIQLRKEISETLQRSDNEQYARLAGEVHDTEEESVADLLVDVNLAEITRDVDELKDVEKALDRIDRGTYGECMRCKEPIPRERLEIYPTAKRCRVCQEAHDRARQVRPPPSL